MLRSLTLIILESTPACSLTRRFFVMQLESISSLSPAMQLPTSILTIYAQTSKKGLNLPKYEAVTDQEPEDMGSKYTHLKSRGWLLKGH